MRLAIALTTAVVGTSMAVPANAAPDDLALRDGQRIVRSGHLEGVSAPGVIVAPYISALSEMLCSPDACDEVGVTVRLPRGRSTGDLAAAVTAPAQSAGLNMRVFDDKGRLVASAQGGGIGGPFADVSSYVIARGLKPGRYLVRTYLSAGVADFKQTLSWKATRSAP